MTDPQSHQLIIGHGSTICCPKSGTVHPDAGAAVLPVNVKMLVTPYHGELKYLSLLQELVDKSEGDIRPDRTGTGTYSVFGRQIRFDLSEGFPLLTTKKVFWKGVVAELLWMLSGDTNAKTLQDQGVHIWDEWADNDGSLGPVYGAQWRSWDACTDQIANVLKSLAEKPHDRGHIVSAWNVAQLHSMALRPCHCLFQFYVEDGKLSCQLYQRSADIFLGVPFNIASYALLTHLIARELDLEPGEFIHTFGDLHLYTNHVQQAKTQLSRTPRPFPKVVVPDHGIFEVTADHIKLTNYDPHPAIEAEVSV